MINELYSVLSRLKGTSGRIEKEEIVSEFKDDDWMKKAFNFLFNDFITTGLDVKKIEEKVSFVGVTPESNLEKMFTFLELNNTGSDFVIAKVQSYIDMNAENDTMGTFLKELFSKTFKAGVTAKTINKAFGMQFIPEFDVQLAHPFDKYADRVNGTFALTTKLDGNRILAKVDADGNPTFFTRKGKPIEDLTEIHDDLKELANRKILTRADYNEGFVLDGEILIKDDMGNPDKFAETMKIVRKNGEKTGLVFWAFDILPIDEFYQGESTAAYLQREEVLTSIFNYETQGTIKRVQPLYIGDDTSVIPVYLQEQIALGEEGLMININTTYKCKRHPGILKVKEFFSSDVLVLDVFEGSGALVGTLGGVIIDWKSFKVKVGSGFTLAERKEIWDTLDTEDTIIGKVIEIQYFEESKNQKNDDISLRFPTFLRTRPDKTRGDIHYE